MYHSRKCNCGQELRLAVYDFGSDYKDDDNYWVEFNPEYCPSCGARVIDIEPME